MIGAVLLVGGHGVLRLFGTTQSTTPGAFRWPRCPREEVRVVIDEEDACGVFRLDESVP